VLIVDDERPVRESLARILHREGYEVIDCPDGLRALEQLRRTAFDAIVTDLEMPGLSGLDLIPMLRTLAPRTPVIVLTAHCTAENAIAALRHGGAYDFLTKPLRDPRALAVVLARAMVSGVGPAVDVVAPVPAEAPPELSLTGRERDLLALLTEGASNAEMAARLCLSERTVRNYLVRLFQKLGVASRTQAALKARAWTSRQEG
jgi:DNA-binding NarL/FixJ family response regulator